MDFAIFTTVFSVIYFSLQVALAVTSRDIVILGPGLRPDKIVLPARYFFVSSINGEPLEEKLFYVSITGITVSGKPCQARTQVFATHDGNFIVRYKIHETCHEMKIIVKYNGLNVGDSPFDIKGPIYHDDCDCPKHDLNQWFDENNCKRANKQIEKDLSAYNDVNFDVFHKQAATQFNNSMQSSVCHYVVKSNKVYRSCYGKYVDFKMFMDALLLSITRKVTLPDVEFLSNLGDWPLIEKNAKNTFPMFSWCGSDNTLDIVMPTYDLTESSLEMMGRVSRDMLSVDGNIKTKWVEKDSKAFFRGRDSSKERLKLIDIARNRPDLINASLTNFFFFHDKEEKYGPKASHISFFKFFDYKYQLNLDGTVAAYRFPYLLAGNSLVFKQDSKYYEHFYNELKPWKHYVPVKSNLDDLVRQLEWALENDAKAQEIAAEGRKYARNNLMPQHIFCYHAHLFNEWSKKLISKVTVRKGMELVEQKNREGCNCINGIKDEL